MNERGAPLEVQLEKYERNFNKSAPQVFFRSVLEVYIPGTLLFILNDVLKMLKTRIVK